MLTKLAMLVFVEAFRSHPESAAIFADSRLYEPIAQALQFIETHPFTDWTVARLASKVGMGRSSFATRFAVDVGKTPMTFVTEERMKHAAALLERTDLKVAEIADQIGYRSESAFSHRFFVHFGMTPGEMRSRKQCASAAQSLADPALLQDDVA
jgi:AraC-like DNA-binding protein